MSSLTPNPNPASTSPGPPAPTDRNDAPFDQHSCDKKEGKAAPTPYPTTTTESLMLKIKSPGLFGRTMPVSFSSNNDPKDSAQENYTYALHFFSKPHIIVTSSSTSGAAIGTVTFHFLSRKDTLVVHGSSIDLRLRNVWMSAYSFESPALGGKRLDWRGGDTSVLVDDEGTVMARRKMSLLLLWKEWTVEILRPWSEEGAVRDEVLLSALAIMEMRRRVMYIYS